MSKLFFYYGTVMSAKTMNLLAAAHAFEEKGKKVLVIKPKIDVRFGENKVKTRAGMERNADLLACDEHLSLDEEKLKDIKAIFVDEAQFLKSFQIDELNEVSLKFKIPVFCYGLKNDYLNRLFEGSKRLMELADSVRELRCDCFFCDKKAIYNIKKIDKKFVFSEIDDVIDLSTSSEEKYLPICKFCYFSFKNKHTK